MLVKIKCMLILRTGQQHHFVAILPLRDLPRIIETGSRIALLPEVFVRDDILDQRIRSLPVRQIRNDDADAGRNDPAVRFRDNDMMIRVMQNARPDALQPVILFGKRVSCSCI